MYNAFTCFFIDVLKINVILKTSLAKCTKLISKPFLSYIIWSDSSLSSTLPKSSISFNCKLFLIRAGVSSTYQSSPDQLPLRNRSDSELKLSSMLQLPSFEKRSAIAFCLFWFQGSQVCWYYFASKLVINHISVAYSALKIFQRSLETESSCKPELWDGQRISVEEFLL